MKLLGLSLANERVLGEVTLCPKPTMSSPGSQNLALYHKKDGTCYFVEEAYKLPKIRSKRILDFRYHHNLSTFLLLYFLWIPVSSKL
jgi:hypothetical protein